MKKFSRYIIKNFIESFNPIFFTLFFMASIIYFIKIAKITAIVKISFLELGEMYIYILPRIIVYTFPIVFFIAITLSLSKMSRDNELGVLFSFGLSPKKIAFIFFILSFLTSLFLLINSILLVPISKQLYKNFIDVKKAEAKLNINAMEFGQKFSNWLVFINKSKKNNEFGNIIMYSKEKKRDNFVIAKNGKVDSSQGILKLVLQNGKAYMIEPKSIKQTDYEKMIIYNSQNMEITGAKGVVSYWLKSLTDKKRAKDFATFILISVFPLITFLLAMSFGIFNPRYETPNSYLYIFTTIFLYYTAMYYTTSVNPASALIIVPLVTLLVSTTFFKKKIVSRY